MKLKEDFSLRTETNFDVSNFSHQEIVHFYRTLLKMKKRRPDLNVKRIMLKLYPNFIIKDNIPKSIL